MGLLTGLFNSAFKLALSPIAIGKDVINAINGQEIEETKDLLGSAAKDALAEGDLF